MIIEQNKLVVSPTHLIFSFWIILFLLIFVGGYAFNFLGLPVAPIPIFIFVCVGFALIVCWVIKRARVIGDIYELGGFLLVCAGTWLYLIVPALPTWMPPSYSGDPALHYAFAEKVITTGQIIGNDPGGPTLVTAMFAQWLGTPLVRLLHPMAALWLALTAGATYGLACTILPPRAESKLLALFAPLYLLLAWDCFAGLILGAHYFFSQATGHLFVIAFAWYLAELVKGAHPFFNALVIASFVAVWVTYPLWLVVPAVIWAWTIWQNRRAGGTLWQRVSRAGLVAALLLLFFMLVTRWTGKEFLPSLEHIRGDGAVMPPTVTSLGGALIPVAGSGILFARQKRQARIAFAMLLAVITLTLFLVTLHLCFGAGKYWYNKSLFLWIFPLALFFVIAFERAYEWLAHIAHWRIVAPAAGLLALVLALFAIMQRAYPSYVFVPLNESDIKVALWAKENLNTPHINYIGPKSVTAQWLGVALWGEKYPPDLWIGLARLGPRTFEEWYDTPGWGEYLFISSNQRHPLTPDLRVVYQDGNSMIVQKPTSPTRAASPRFVGTVLSLVDFDLPHTTFRPGEALAITMQIQTQRFPSHRVVWRFQARDLQNNLQAEAHIEPFDAQFPMQRWPPGVVLTQTLALRLPTEIQPGLYDLQLGLYFVGSGEPLAFSSAEGSQDDVIHLSRIKVALPPVSPHELAALTRVDAQIGDAFRLLGYRVRKTSPLRPGDSFDLILYWHARARDANNYTVFVHLLNSLGQLVAQRDTAPRAGTYPTSIWAQDEIVPDAYTLTIPHDAPPGDYRLILGMYTWPRLERLPVTDVAQRAQSDHFELPIIIRVE